MTRDEARAAVIGLLTAHAEKSNEAFEAIWYTLDDGECTRVAAELVSLVSIQMRAYAKVHGTTFEQMLVDLGREIALDTP